MLLRAQKKTTKVCRIEFGSEEVPGKTLRDKSISIYHECEGGIEKSVPRFTDWHHEACRVMTIGDCEGQTFLSHPHTNNGFFFLLTNKYLIL